MCEQAKLGSRLARVGTMMAARSDCRAFFGGRATALPSLHLPQSGAYARAGYQEGGATGKKMKVRVSFNSNVIFIDVPPFRTLSRGLSATDDLNLKSVRNSAAKPASHWQNQSLATHLTVL